MWITAEHEKSPRKRELTETLWELILKELSTAAGYKSYIKINSFPTCEQQNEKKNSNQNFRIIKL